nr:phage holin family protein [Bacillus velezensis]
MEGIHVWMNFESLQIARTYLFGEVKYLDLLLILSILDVITGIIKAWKMKRLRSRSAWFGYVRKMLSFMVVIVANIIDTITNLNGVLTFGTVLFYIANEGLSITENLAQIGVKIPAVITDRLHVIESDNDQKTEKDDQADWLTRSLF